MAYEDDASVDHDQGVNVLTVRKDTAAATAGTDGDYQSLITDSNGRLHVIGTGDAVLGTSTGAAVVTDANGTIQQYLRGLVKLVVAKLSVYITGAANIAIGQVTAGNVSATLVASRATRRTVTVRNQDTTNSAYIGTGTVTSGNGFLLKAGESVSIDTVAGLNSIRDTADVALGYVETYD